MSKEGIRPVTDADQNAVVAHAGKEAQADAEVERLLEGFLQSLVAEQLKAMK